MRVLVGIVTGVDGGLMTASSELLENRMHGDAMFPLAVYHVVLTPGPYQQSVNLHWHRETEFVLVTKGAVRARVEMETVVLTAGQLLLVNSEAVHALEAAAPVSEAYAIVFDLMMLASAGYDQIQHRFIKRLLDGEHSLPTAVTGVDPRDSRLATYAAEIVDAYADKTEAYELLIKASLYRIVYELWAGSRLVPMDATEPDEGLKLTRIKPILSFIHQHYAEPIRLKDLSDLINMSEGYFCRYFHRLVGVTPVQYINEYRITQAVHLLQSSDCSVLEACYEVGFQNISYFTRVFKHYRRCNPSDLRRRQ